MPATAGRVRMPANNRVHSSAALQTHGIWQSTIGYDPYAPTKSEAKNTSSQPKETAVEPDGENAYASFQGLLALARITGSNNDECRGACKKCGRVGHLTFQCRNFLSIKDEKEKDQDAIQADVLSGLEKLRKASRGGKGVESSDESSEEESESSDSEYDSEIERAIAKKHGKKPSSGKVTLVKKKRVETESGEDSDSDSRRGRSKKRRSKKRSKSESDDEDDSGKKRKDKRKRISRKDTRRRRSHRYSRDDDSDDSDRRHKRRSRREADSDNDVSRAEDKRSGRDKKRSEKRSHNHKRHRD